MSRLDRIKEQNKALDISIIDILAKCDPSGNHKYLDFLLKMLKQDINSEINNEIYFELAKLICGEEQISLLNNFHGHLTENRIPNSDIGSYHHWSEMNTAVERADEIKRISEAEKKIKKLYDENGWLVLIPLSLEASQKYGSNTKWCVTQERHWRSYHQDYKLIFIIDKNSNEKYAISSKVNDRNNIDGWTSDDTNINPLLLDIPSEVMKIIREDIKKYETIYDLINGGKTVNVNLPFASQYIRFIQDNEIEIRDYGYYNPRDGRYGENEYRDRRYGDDEPYRVGMTVYDF